MLPQDAYVDFPKDERLKPGKDTRLINGCSIQETIEWRRYTSDFFVAFQTAGLKVGSAIGVNMFGFGMNDICNKLLSNSSVCVDGDFQAFGPRLMPECVYAVGKLVNSWYTHHVCVCEDKDKCKCGVSADNKVRELLFMGLVNCNHVAGDLMYKTYCGSPSGSPITAPINTLVHILYLRIIWLLVFKDTVYADLYYFHKYFSYVCYGDDGLYSISPKFKDSFNCVTISECLAKFGIVFTDAGKTGTKKYDTIENCTFLKCHPLRHPYRDIWLAGLAKSVIEDIPNWLRKPYFNLKEQEMISADMALRFSFFWGKEYFDTNKSLLLKKFRETGHHLVTHDWDALDRMFESGVAIPWIEEWESGAWNVCNPNMAPRVSNVFSDVMTLNSCNVRKN